MVATADPALALGDRDAADGRRQLVAGVDGFARAQVAVVDQVAAAGLVEDAKGGDGAPTCRRLRERASPRIGQRPATRRPEGTGGAGRRILR